MTLTTLIILAAAVMVVVLFAILGGTAKAKGPDFQYTKNPTLFSPAERSFLGVLEQAIPDEYRFFGKVRVADVVSVHKMRDRSRWTRAFNLISAKHFDYVLCRKDNLSIVCVIELDDSSHHQKKRKVRDEFLSGVCQAALLPLIQIPAQQGYSENELRTKILAMLSPVVANPASATNENLGRIEPTLHEPA